MTIHSDQLEYLERARRNLEPFRRWLVRTQGVHDDQADVTVALVCRATWESAADGADPDPVNMLDRDLSEKNFYRLRSSLRYYYVWLLGDDPSGPKSTYYRRQLSRLEITKWSGGLVRTSGSSRSRAPAPPLPRPLFDKILKNAKRWNRSRRGVRYPWFWPVVLIKIKLGWQWKDIVAISRVDLMRAMDDGRYGTIRQDRTRQSSTVGSRSAPISLIRSEADTLVNWPWSWGVLADLVSPASPSRRRRASSAKMATRAMRRYLLDMLPEEYSGVDAVSRRLATSGRVWLLEQLRGDWIALAQITGRQIDSLRAEPALVEEAARFEPR